MIRDVGTPFILIGEGVDVLVGSKRRDSVVVTVSVGREGVVRGGIQSAARSEGSYRSVIKVMIEAIKPRGSD
jgi:hypothetical protein